VPPSPNRAAFATACQVGYLLEELRDASNFKALQADVASANIFVGSLIFIEELADKVGHAGTATTCVYQGSAQRCQTSSRRFTGERSSCNTTLQHTYQRELQTPTHVNVF
jgi:Domain of unknown function (DUF3479)